MIAGEIHFAARDKETAVDEIDQPVGQVAGEVGAKVSGAVFAQAPSDENLRISIGEGELDVRVSLVIAQQDIEARLALLDQIVFQRKSFMFIGYRDVVDVHCLPHQGARLGVGLGSFQKVRADSRTQILRLADVDHLALGVLVEVAAGQGGDGADFLQEVHRGESLV